MRDLKSEDIQRFLGDHDGGDGPLKVTEAAPYKVGDSVNVKDGPFIDFSGVVQEVNHEKSSRYRTFNYFDHIHFYIPICSST